MISYQFRIVYTSFKYALKVLKVYQVSPFHQRTIIQAIFEVFNSYTNQCLANNASCSGSLRSDNCFNKGFNTFNCIFRYLIKVHPHFDVTNTRILVINEQENYIFLLVFLYQDFLISILNDLYFVESN